MKPRFLLVLILALMSVVLATVSAAGDVKAQCYNSNTAIATNTIALNIKLVNTGTAAIPLSAVKFRYYFTNDGTQSNSFACDWASAGNANVSATFANIAAVSNADRYCEVGFSNGAGTLAASASTFISFRIWKTDWSNFNQSNDFSFNQSAISYVDRQQIPLYLDSQLDWGTTPDGTVTPSTIPTISPTAVPTPTPTATGATPTPLVTPATVYKFDFGGGPVQSGYIGVSASLGYNAARGYGFNSPSNMANVSASGTGVNADAVRFLAFGVNSANTFNVDLPVGLYEITVTLGNCARSSVAAEGVFQIMNMTGNNAVDQVQIPVTDGQLNLLVTDGKTGTAHTLSALEIKRISTNPAMNKTVWIGGDSTVCNYYPLINTDNSAQAGWGQMLATYINASRYQIRNMATGGQIARGFLNDGQFAAIMKYLKPGDILILQFGINDVASKNATTAAQFTEYMGTMVDRARASGATVVLNTPQGRATNWTNNVHTCLNASYRPQTVALAAAKNVPLVDLCVLSSQYYTSIGQTATTALYLSDNLHLNRLGATQLARLEYDELTRQNLLK